MARDAVGSWKRGAGLVAAALALALALPSGATAEPLKRCKKRSPIQCGAVSVPLDRSGAVAGKVKLSVARLPARKGPSRGTVMLIAGGPGESALGALALTGLPLSSALPRYDIVAFDQRGTGESGRLRCRALRKSGGSSVAAAFARCAEQLGPKRALYRTTDSVDDIEAVRAYVRAPTLSLLAVSYGARVAGEYVRRYPSSSARLVLDSPVPLSGSDPFNRQVQAALPRVLSALCADKACPFTASPYRDLTRLARRIGRRPLRGQVIDGSGKPRRAAVTQRLLHALVSASDLDPLLRASLPAAVHVALKGDAAPLLRLASSASGGAAGIAAPLTAATLCSESALPWDVAQPPGTQRRAALQAALAGLGSPPFAPFEPRAVVAGGILGICRDWPAVPNRFAVAGGVSAVPTLILSGTEDLRTPYEQARTVAEGYSSAALLAVPQTGHSAIGGSLRACATRATVRFLRGAVPPASCPSKPRPGVTAVAKPPPAGLGAVAGDSRAERIRTAVRLTVRDAARQLLAKLKRRFGGLRGGSARLERRRLVLEDYEYVRGVAIGGELRDGKGDQVEGTVYVRVGDAAPFPMVL